MRYIEGKGMAYESKGSVMDRLRAVRVRDDLIRKQEQDPMGMMEAGVQNVPGPNGAEGVPQHMLGGANASALGQIWTQIDEAGCNALLDMIGQGERIASTYAGANIHMGYSNELDMDFLQLRSKVNDLKKLARALREKHKTLSVHDPTQMANDQTNGDLAAMTMGGGF